MSDWIAQHRESLEWLVGTTMGCFLIVLGTTVVGDSEPGLIALGAGALGWTGYSHATTASTPPPGWHYEKGDENDSPQA